MTIATHIKHVLNSNIAQLLDTRYAELKAEYTKQYCEIWANFVKQQFPSGVSEAKGDGATADQITAEMVATTLGKLQGAGVHFHDSTNAASITLTANDKSVLAALREKHLIQYTNLDHPHRRAFQFLGPETQTSLSSRLRQIIDIARFSLGRDIIPTTSSRLSAEQSAHAQRVLTATKEQIKGAYKMAGADESHPLAAQVLSDLETITRSLSPSGGPTAPLLSTVQDQDPKADAEMGLAAAHAPDRMSRHGKPMPYSTYSYGPTAYDELLCWSLCCNSSPSSSDGCLWWCCLTQPSTTTCNWNFSSPSTPSSDCGNCGGDDCVKCCGGALAAVGACCLGTVYKLQSLTCCCAHESHSTASAGASALAHTPILHFTGHALASLAAHAGQSWPIPTNLKLGLGAAYAALAVPRLLLDGIYDVKKICQDQQPYQVVTRIALQVTSTAGMAALCYYAPYGGPHAAIIGGVADAIVSRMAINQVQRWTNQAIYGEANPGKWMMKSTTIANQLTDIATPAEDACDLERIYNTAKMLCILARGAEASTPYCSAESLTKLLFGRFLCCEPKNLRDLHQAAKLYIQKGDFQKAAHTLSGRYQTVFFTPGTAGARLKVAEPFYFGKTDQDLAKNPEIV